MLTIVDDGKPAPPVVFQALVPVRWGDQDADGHVNNVVILRYVEEARMQWARALALHDAVPPMMSVVANLACEFLAPIHYPETLAVSIACAHVGNSSVQLLFTLQGAAAQPYARARMTWVWLDTGTRRPRSMPEALRRACTAVPPDTR